MSFDQIADMLIRIRNAQQAGKPEVLMQASKLKLAVAQVLYRNNYLGETIICSEGNKNFLKIKLRYESQKPLIKGIEQVSHQGQRIYAGKKEIPVVRNGYGMAIVSTSKGVMTDKEAREKGIGGEVICKIW
jgi:small subunit ribosomal protein S8